MTYRRIETTADLPPPGPLRAGSRETGSLDFKRAAAPDKMAEHAKDIASFANALGGVILVGADGETGGELRYLGVGGRRAQEVVKLYEDAARLCSPSPVVDVLPIKSVDHSDLVAVNVDPYIDQVVGAPVPMSRKRGHSGSRADAWTFPIRVASQTKFIRPENLPMYMNHQVRRSVLLLAKIPDGFRAVTVHFHTQMELHNRHGAGMMRMSQMECRLGGVSVEKNAASLELDQLGNTLLCRVPLLDVLDVWECAEHKWAVKIAGGLRVTGTSSNEKLEYFPLPHPC